MNDLIFIILSIISAAILILLLFVIKHKMSSDKKDESIISTIELNKKIFLDSVLEIKKDTNKQIELLAKKLDKLGLQNIELKKRIDFFTNIGEDSKNLNEINNTEENKFFLSEAIKEVSEINKLESELIDSKSQKEFKKSDSNEKDSKNSILDEIQLNVCRVLETTNQNCFITGRAGTGKSFLLESFVHGTNKRVLVLAPTGVASININGATIHSAFGFNNLEQDIDSINKSTLKLKSEKQIVLKNVDVIIIDEVSMVRCDILDKIDKILRIINGKDIVFGGKQLVVVGDLFQLPPIAKKDEYRYLYEKYGGIFFFNSNAFKSGDFKFFELTKNHRQESDQNFFNILNNIREGIVDDKDIETINTRYISSSEDLRRVPRLFPKKDQAIILNNNELDKIQAREYVFDAKIINNKNKSNINIESNFAISDKLRLKLGALVMIVKNDKHKRWVNGTLGIISGINNYSIKVKINDVEYEIEKQCFDMIEARYENGKINYDIVFSVEQYPIVLAYAITIHKSQGMTYKKVACDIKECFENGQAYVALSRSSSLNGLYLLNQVRENDIQVNQEIMKFYKKIKK